MKSLDRIDPALKYYLSKRCDLSVSLSSESVKMHRKLHQKNSELGSSADGNSPRILTINKGGQKLRLFVYDAATSNKVVPCLLWFHGGGYYAGSADEKFLGPHFTEHAECMVISVEYSLAPEYPFPAGLQDAEFALNWVYQNANRLNIDRDRIAIGGASAGAGLAASLALSNRDNKGPEICFQLLLYPMLDNLHDTPSGKIRDHPVWNRQKSLAAWEMYLNGVPGLGADYYAAPIRTKNLFSLPNTFIAVGEVDLFYDECLLYAAQLSDCGVDACIRVYRGVYHGAELVAPSVPICQTMVGDYTNALKKSFG